MTFIFKMTKPKTLRISLLFLGAAYGIAVSFSVSIPQKSTPQRSCCVSILLIFFGRIGTERDKADYLLKCGVLQPAEWALEASEFVDDLGKNAELANQVVD